MSLRHRLLTTAVAFTVTLAGAASAQDRATDPIQMNQVGFLTQGPKRATVVDTSESPLPWRVVDTIGTVITQGETRPRGFDTTSGVSVHEVDFGALQIAGTGYRLQVGQRLSRPFTIADRPFGALGRDALAFFYQNRSGIPIAAEHVQRADLARPAGHAPDRATCFAGADVRGNVWPGCAYTLDVSAGWYDAGDQGKYVVNGGIAVWTLLNVYERAKVRNIVPAFPDGTADIPEAGNGVDDLLDEARWELEFLLKMQVPDGEHANVPVGRFARDQPLTFTRIDAGGLVHHKVHDARWTPLPTAPADDPETRYLYGPNTAATLNLVAVAAQCARLWRDIDAGFARTCLTAAERGFAAAQRHPDLYAVGSFDGGGDYGDDNLTDEFYWAAAEMYATTGDPRYLAFLGIEPGTTAAAGSGGYQGADISWNSVSALGAITLATAPGRLSSSDQAEVRRRLIDRARVYLDEGSTQGYGLPFAGPGYNWGSNADLLNRAIILGVAHDLTGEQGFADGVVAALDYVLGRNPLDQSYVTGYGARPMRNPHHRYWAHSLDPAYPAPPAGVLSGGPNNQNMSDPVAETMRGTCTPQTCWRDDVRAFSQNEVAINWNAPLVWVTTYLDRP
ncbi:glycoside hydrolase family 9 protein [Brevundimonas subvibrioides]|uniref:glycoside hydrolase family 9 protein n=1 Tax=Brevundimonas subvibrioides TaxID=74313 RepID=UPI0022B557D3|nr:glycoside hydrolase family 9 protein [Brevundimonas subvibrioides]